MPERTAQPTSTDQRILAPRITVAMLLCAPLAIVWGLRHPTLTSTAKFGLIALSVIMLLLQLVLLLVLGVLWIIPALPPWMGTTVAVGILAIIIAIGGAMIATRRASTPGGAWGLTCIAFVLALLLVGFFGRPIQTVQAISFRLPIVTMAQALLEEGKSYPTAGRHRVADGIVDLTESDLPDGDANGERFHIGPCEFEMTGRFLEDEPDAGMLRFQTARGTIALAEAEPLRERLFGTVGHGAPLPAEVRALFDYEHDYALAEAMYATTYDDVRTARNIDELIHHESLYAFKLFAGLKPPVRRFEGSTIHGYFSATNDVAAADVFDRQGNQILEVQVVAMDVFADADLLERELLRVLASLRCDDS